MNGVGIVFKRELLSYVSTSLAYLFTVIFLVLSGIFTFYLGHFFERGQADLEAFFNYIPWLFVVLVPALTMRLWAEERSTGTIELLLTLPVQPFVWVLGKFMAAWVYLAGALALTTPFWFTVNYLGDPDNGAILAGYIGSWFMAGGFLALGSMFSAATKNQVIAFILTLVVCFLLVASGFPMVQDFFSAWAPNQVLDLVADLSFFRHFEAISRGVIDLRDVLYFGSIIVLGVWATAHLVKRTASN
ncbi:ABC-type transport system involved in multi-copper enzyme maturation, permease component [Hahella chejuensis KCTC 2396]|uniref:ABC-type transport system involved in multi-copper enzyme maturation, permease component n=1 Tax=Hahella chejuensis (strain KCTC 2396) TaxID=349521 RepID=Q2SC59_HAHCH|nr:ABC transporter permease [Hahella chejuensis]ABC31765.1 ABC-type transport system involved in multi-copper enzyme maturation, permease component [Hahella chejuensis KCTC 2396]